MTRLLVPMFLSFGVLPGCGMSQDMDAQTMRAQRAYAAAQARLDAHHAAVDQAADAEAARQETDAYVQEMDGLVDDMTDACRAMMGAGMMSQEEGAHMADAGTTMHDEIERHRASIDGMDDMAAMRAECDEHHAAMKDVLDEAGAVMEHMTQSCCGGMM
jgi:hypothetical protein